MPVIHIWEETGLREFFFNVQLWAEAKKRHEGQCFHFGNLVYPHLELSCQSQSGCEGWLSLGTRQGHRRMEVKPSRVFFMNQSYYPTPIHTVSPTLWKTKTPTFHFTMRKLSSNPGKNNLRRQVEETWWRYRDQVRLLHGKLYKKWE